MNEPVEIDWNDDEAVVQGAFRGRAYESGMGHKCFRDTDGVPRWLGATWKEARDDFRVARFERLNRPGLTAADEAQLLYP